MSVAAVSVVCETDLVALRYLALDVVRQFSRTAVDPHLYFEKHYASRLDRVRNAEDIFELIDELGESLEVPAGEALRRRWAQRTQ